jgi:hypothetical protein
MNNQHSASSRRNQWNWSNHPVIVSIGLICLVIGTIITIINFVDSREKKQNPTTLTKGFFVIGFADYDKNKVVKESARQKASGVANQITYSSDWSDLEPGWYIIVYGVYTTHLEAESRKEFLERQKINTYIKYSGYNVATFGSQ